MSFVVFQYTIQYKQTNTKPKYDSHILVTPQKVLFQEKTEFILVFVDCQMDHQECLSDIC